MKLYGIIYTDTDGDEYLVTAIGNFLDELTGIRLNNNGAYSRGLVFLSLEETNNSIARSSIGDTISEYKVVELEATENGFIVVKPKYYWKLKGIFNRDNTARYLTYTSLYGRNTSSITLCLRKRDLLTEEEFTSLSRKFKFEPSAFEKEEFINYDTIS